MVDGKGILDALLGAAAVNGKQGQGAAQGGGLEDLLGQMMGGRSNPSQQPGDGSGGFLNDMLGQVLGGGNAPQQHASNPGGGGGLGDLLGQLFGNSPSQPQSGHPTQTGGGGLGDMLGQILGGANAPSGGLFDVVKNAVTNNPGITQAALAGMAGLVLTSSKARGLATGAAKLGGIALIGGLAYQAIKNYQSKNATSPDDQIKPEDYNPVAADNDGALKMVQVMIAAAMADGRLDAAEQQKILGHMSQNALSPDQAAWLKSELTHPATAQQVAAGITTEQEAIEAYTAASIVIDPDSVANKTFLDTLASELSLPRQLVAEIERAVDGVKVENAS